MAPDSTILITGASSGIGKDAARSLAQRGYTVYAAARRIEKMEDLKEVGVIPLKLDITQEEGLQAAVDTITQAHGGVDVLINNAGYGLYGSMEETTLEDARYQFEVNLFGLARLTQLVPPPHARTEIWPYHQRLLCRWQNLHSARQLVSRLQART